MPEGQEVQFKSPTTGQVQAIPPEHWDEALKMGYTPTTHKVMYSPEGQRGMVSNAEVADHAKQGFQTTPQTAFEQNTAPPTTLDLLNRYAGKALSGAGLPASFNDIPNWFSHLTGQAEDSKPFYQPAVDAYKNPTQRNIVGAIPFVGPAAVSMSDDVRAGNYGDAAATLTGSLAGARAAGEVPAGVRAGKAELIDATRLPNNKLTPAARVVSKVAGAAAGHAVGVPGAGELGGYILGPQVADAVLPNRPPTPNFYGGAYEPPVQPFYGPATPTAAQFRLSQRLAPPAEPAPVYPGAPLPSAEDFYSARGAEINAMRKMQPDAFAPPKPPFVDPGAPLPDPNDFYSARGEELNRIRSMNESLSAKQARQSAVAQKESGYQPPITKVPVAQEPGYKLTPESVPGPDTAGKGNLLTPLAKAGDPRAAMELARRGRRVLFVQEGGYAPPKETVNFGTASDAYGPSVAYRAHDVGDIGIDLNSPAHATVSPDEAKVYAEGRGALEGAPPQTVSKINLSKFDPAHYDLVPGPRGNQWVRFKRPLEPGDFE